ncbi:hypothetical protein TARUN_6420 [Trichoderma arundinaceum]|uniref:DUF6546 domain-containing protein n=1 Tax=Trichoderma arundinaceum TaxID=490622 RepID=A0A395NIJ4_TRIAR|nr:hypothetical protein TARUN_6420 [Trichoderma arundinaceum]
MPTSQSTRHSSRVFTRMPRQLKTVHPSQRKLPFSELQTEISDEGYEEGFALLYSEINKFLKDGIGKRAVSSRKSLWTQKHSKEFLSFVSMVARPGADDEWEKLPKSRPYRCALLSGVILMVLDRHVFSDLLFGAGPEHAQVLRMEDSSMVNIEGFRRTGLRADTNRVYLEATGGVPPMFWKNVDRITAQIVAMLSPLYAAIGEEAPSRSSYQALHDIVALAGWLNVAIRLSPKITVFEWVQPGEAYRHSHLCIGEEKTTASPSHRKAQDARNCTRVMISAAPRITRYARGSEGLFTGTATYEAMQPHVSRPQQVPFFSVSPSVTADEHCAVHGRALPRRIFWTNGVWRLDEHPRAASRLSRFWISYFINLDGADGIVANSIVLSVSDVVVRIDSSTFLAGFATVSREWQTIIERHNFSRIKLTPSRLVDFGSVIHRNRALVRYIWLCLELEEYDCTECAPEDPNMLGFSNTDNTMITTAFQHLFSTLSQWEPNGNLLLDISIHSTSDSEHWFKYLTFRPDIPSGEVSQGRYAEQSMLIKVDDHQHGWIAGRRDAAPSEDAIWKVFDEIIREGPFGSEEDEADWWRQLPLVPAVTGVLLRQQNRRRWNPAALARMLTRLPSLKELHYEPWREWYNAQQRDTDKDFRVLFESLACTRLRRLVLFENFNQQYPHCIWDCDPIRTPTPNVSQAVANASLKLEHLAASFIVDASYFFFARRPSWKWPNLTWLALTSRLLTHDESPIAVDTMLRAAAAAAAMKMPNLKAMEIWNGREGLAMLFRYQLVERGAVITCRGTWEFALRPPVIQAWEAVTLNHGGRGTVIVKELLDISSVKSHGDAIHQLEFSKPVVRPVSLWQIRMEHKIRGGVLPTTS